MVVANDLQQRQAMKLHELAPNRKARVRTIASGGHDLEAKLREVGFSEGDEVEMVGHGPLGGQTLAVRVNRTIIAMRAPEAALIEVDPE